MTEVAAAAAAIQQQRQVYLSGGATLKRVYDTLRQPGSSRQRELHETLDRAVYRAYGSSADDPLLAQLLALNLDLAARPEQEVRRPGGAGLAGIRKTDFKVTA